MSRGPRKPQKKKVAPGKGKATSKKAQTKVFKCGTNLISKLRRELQGAGLALRDTSGRSQCETLLRVLQYLGPRGINTPEGVGCGFYRIATRIQELEAGGWLIASNRERLVGADGLVHNGIARYVLRGRRTDFVNPQGTLDLGAQA
jgi:hypothetical protein